MLAWLPTYFTDTMNLTISQAAQFSLLPPLAALGTSAVAGPAADALISRGWDVAVVRKSMQSVAFLGPTTCLLGASVFTDGYTPLGRPCLFDMFVTMAVSKHQACTAAMSLWHTVHIAPTELRHICSQCNTHSLADTVCCAVLITLGLGLASCSLAGLYCNHADLSPRYAGILLGLTNTTGALPGIMGVAITGALLDLTGASAGCVRCTCS